ncbi:hypothetical protein P7K49_024238 [Saguinus oedipus]|uniref:Uncharacterized protein n=1 Tax=Saguinus oedipus TaxID=9490 RepID=A0ABQ9UNZ3_SAGOE|nr:hypothetical protein P7K49_024238 [Saguinus oedipus]
MTVQRPFNTCFTSALTFRGLKAREQLTQVDGARGRMVVSGDDLLRGKGPQAHKNQPEPQRNGVESSQSVPGGSLCPLRGRPQRVQENR